MAFTIIYNFLNVWLLNTGAKCQLQKEAFYSEAPTPKPTNGHTSSIAKFWLYVVMITCFQAHMPQAGCKWGTIKCLFKMCLWPIWLNIKPLFSSALMSLCNLMAVSNCYRDHRCVLVMNGLLNVPTGQKSRNPRGQGGPGSEHVHKMIVDISCWKVTELR